MAEQGPEGYKKLVVWRNARELRFRIYKISNEFPKSEVRRVSQMRDAARSVKQNIQEGYQRRSLGEYIHSLEISKASLGELQGDLEDCFEDRLITKDEIDILFKLCHSAIYLSTQYLKTMWRPENQAKWKTLKNSTR